MLHDALHEGWKTSLHGFLSGDLLNSESHPGKKLVDHLVGTAVLAQKLIDKHGLDESAHGVALAAYTHDLGKVHPDFQLHLYGKGKGEEHSAPSSFFTYASSVGKERKWFDLFFSAEAVRRHHTKIDNWDILCQYWMAYEDSLPSINAKMKRLISQWSFEIGAKEWRALMNGIFEIDEEDNIFPFYWFKLRTILSFLVAADRMDAIYVDDIRFAPFPEYKEYPFVQRKKMDAWRADIAEQCLKKAEEVQKPGLFTLTLPTGSGKTNIGLKTAHLLAKKLGYETIIYALPFISIVEQNAEFAKAVFDPQTVQEDHSLMLLPEEVAEDEEKMKTSIYVGQGPWKRAMRLFRYWGSPVVVTTMVQLWETLYNPRANATIDFHRLSKAVVLMDEPQGIDPHLWKGLGDTLAFIHKQWGTVFILMTATQPKIIQGHELAPASLQFPFNRHRYRVLCGKHPLSDLPILLERNIASFKEKSGMVVLNTRKSAWETYRLLKPLLGDDPVFVMTRWMTSVHRRETLAKIKELEKQDKRHYLIATQVVEAGVDLDFDWVFRDMGPLDSLIQVAGRCNRSALRDEGLVLIAELCSDKGKSFSKMVYNEVLLDKTRTLLIENKEFEDRDVPSLIEKYYAIVIASLCQSPVWKNIEKGIWGEYIPLFKDEGYDVPVYVDHDGKLDSLLDALAALDKNLENREQLKGLQNKLQQYSIGVGKSHLETWQARVGSFIGIGEEMLEFRGDDYCIIRQVGIGEGADQIYHPTAGFHPPLESIDEERW